VNDSNTTPDELVAPAPHAAGAITADLLLRGTLLAVFASFCYTASIIALRAVAKDGLDWAAWVSCLKAVPTVAVALLILGIQSRRGSIVWPSRRMMIALIASGTAMQILGNLGFQWGLARGGMTLTVPLSQATLLISGAVLGVVAIGEHVSRRSSLAMSVLILAICLLSIDADPMGNAAADQLKAAGAAGQGGGGGILLTVALGLAAGIGWGQAGVVIRQVAKSGVSTAVTILLLSSTAIFVLGGGVLVRQGPGWILEQTSAKEFWIAMVAGAFTSLAFFALTMALKHISIVRANLINASQIALTSLAGFVLFDEPMTRLMIIGTGLTIGGLLLMDRPAEADTSD
jgi:drug/metabolite transporter (DMT)-like permease